MHQPTSLTLLERVRKHDSAAWERFVHLYGPLVNSWGRFWGLNDADAEDLAQDVFQAVATGLDNFRRDRPGDTFHGWLKGVARHKLLDWRRKAKRFPSATGGTDAQIRMNEVSEPDDPDDSASEMSALYHRALALIREEFEPKTWQAFWRVTVDGLTPALAGQELGMTQAGVRMAKSRVLSRLREEVGDVMVA